MAALLVIWALCGWSSFCIGSLALSVSGSLRGIKACDRLIIVLWIGYAGLCNLLLLLSVFQPLHPSHFLAGTVLATAAFLGRKRLRIGLSFLNPGEGKAVSLDIALLATAIAAISIQVVSSRDSITYHYDIIHWLSRIGTVPGLALIHERLGYLSSMYTFSAAFNHGPLTYRTATLGNGFVLLLAAGQIQLVAFRILKGRGRETDFHLALALPLVVALSLLLNHPVSSTPDFAALILTIIVPWTMYLARHEEIQEGSMPARNRLIPLLLAAASVTVKITTLPLFAAALLFYAAGVRGWNRSVVLGGVLAAAVVLPLLVANTTLTGCFLYPLPACFDLPWTPPRGTVPFAEFFLSVRRSYFGSIWTNKQNFIVFGWVVLGGLGFLWLLWRRAKELPSALPMALTSLAGLVFLLLVAPHARYAAGYAATLLALPLLLMRTGQEGGSGLFHTGARGLSLVLATALIATPSVAFKTRSEKRIAAALYRGTIELRSERLLLLPPEIPMLIYDDDNDLALPAPPRKQNPDLAGEEERGMYYPLVEKRRIVFRKPEEGAAGGFIRSSRKTPRMPK